METELKSKIQNHSKTNYASSPHEFDDDEIERLIEADCSCECCGESIFEIDDFPVIRDDRVLCNECEIDKYYSTCPICQDHFEKATKAEDFYFVISKEVIEENYMDMKPGFYHTKEWPFYFGNCVTGFDAFFENTIELVKECDINSMLKSLDHGSSDEVNCDEVCHDCLNTWTGKSELVNNYCNQEYGAKYIAKQKEIIERGY